MKFKKLIHGLLSLFIVIVPLFGGQNAQAAQLSVGSFPAKPSSYTTASYTPSDYQPSNYSGNVHFANSNFNVGGSSSVTVTNGGAYFDGNLNVSGNAPLTANGTTYVKGQTAVLGSGQLIIKSGEGHFNGTVSLAGDTPLKVENGNGYFYNSVSINGSSGTTINGDAIFSKGLTVTGNSSATIAKDAAITGGSTSLTGSSVVTLNGDLYVKENKNFTYEGTSRICVKGTLYYEGDTPPEHTVGPCSGAAWPPGLYVSNIGTAPIINIIGIENITQTSADVKVGSTGTGKIYYMVKPKGQTPPTVTEIKNGNFISVTANIQATINVTGLQSDTNYEVFLIGENTSNIVSKEFKTLQPLSGPNLTFNVTPIQPSGYLIDRETGVAVADIKANIIPHGEYSSEERLKPTDVVFIMDVSGSMDRGLLGQILGGLFGIDSKLDIAKKASKNTINSLKTKVIQGDRIALITFNGDVKEVYQFNPENQSKKEIETHLENLNKKIDKLKAGGGTNYYAALTRAKQLLNGSNSSKYIVFLSDGMPENGPDSVIRNVDGMFSKCLICKKDYIKQDNVTVKNNLLKTFSIFNYSGNNYVYSKYETYHLAAIDAANSLAEQNTKIYSIGLGKWSNSDKEFLAKLSSVTGAQSYTASTYDELSSRLNHISSEMEQTAITNIQVKINLKQGDFPENGHFSIPEDSNAVLSDDGNNLIVSIPDIDYLKGKGTPGELPKIFTMEFDKAGDYTFNEVTLTYTDISGQQQTVSTSPLTVKILDNFSIGLKFKQEMYPINVYINKDVKNKILTNEVEVVPAPDQDPKDAKIPDELVWSSSNEQVATVDSYGNVTATGVGSALITVASAEDPNIKGTTEVKVNLNGKTALEKNNVQYGYSQIVPALIIKPIPEGFYLPDDAFIWSSKDPEILSIDDKTGTMTTGSKNGYTLITATLVDKYKINSSSEKVEVTALVKVIQTETKAPINPPTKEW